jgi:hypothetical protein
VITHDGAWLPSMYWGLPAVGLAVLACLVLTIWAVRFSLHGTGDAFDRHSHWSFAWIPALALPVTVIASMFGYYPYDGDYHRLQPATGVVQAVDTRFLAASQYVVVTYDTGLVVRCDDSRCATVRVGEQLRLLCTKEHQFGSPLAADGWGCRWGEQ